MYEDICKEEEAEKVKIKERRAIIKAEIKQYKIEKTKNPALFPW